MAVQPIPEGFPTATPYLIIDGAADAIGFYKRAFSATETMRMVTPNNTVGHAEIVIGTSPIMLADECPDGEFKGPQAYGGTPVSIMLYVDDVDSVFAQAVAAGATVIRPLQDQFYGDRCGTLRDPFGHVWNVATHVEDVSLEEVERRAAELFGGGDNTSTTR